MTREEILARKKRLSIEIAKAICEFEKDTRIEVVEIGLDVKIGFVGEKRTSVDIYLKNPYEE